MIPTKPGLDQILIFHMLKNTDNTWIQIELEAISNNTTDDVVVKADGKIGNSLSSQQHFVQFVTRPIHEKKRIGDNFTIIVHVMGLLAFVVRQLIYSQIFHFKLLERKGIFEEICTLWIPLSMCKLQKSTLQFLTDTEVVIN